MALQLFYCYWPGFMEKNPAARHLNSEKNLQYQVVILYLPGVHRPGIRIKWYEYCFA